MRFVSIFHDKQTLLPFRYRLSPI